MSPSDARLGLLIGPILPGLEEMRGLIEKNLADESGAVSDMTSHIARFRGKQLRGTLVMLVAKAHGCSTHEHPKVAAIVEMIHLATLVHDDVLDGAEVRRRVACVNERWDNQVAVLLGDFLYARAFGLSTELSSRLCSRMLSETTRRLCVGEIEQSTCRYDFEMSQEKYERIAMAKTGTLYAAACELGVRYPGGDESVGLEMRAFGSEIGLAFQIIDDCLDVQGDEAVVGKSVGNDVEDGKVTLPVLCTYAQANETTRALIRDAYTRPEIENRLARLREVCDLGPGTEYAFERSRTLVGRALERLTNIPDSPTRRALESMGEFVLQRHW